jgi:hypothetical protein
MNSINGIYREFQFRGEPGTIPESTTHHFTMFRGKHFEVCKGAYALALSMSGSGVPLDADVSNSNCSCPLSAETFPR